MVFWKYKLISLGYLALSLLYLAQSFIVETPQATLDKYHISSSQAHALSVTISLPYVVIWFIALAGYLRLKQYTDSISSSTDGRAFRTISYGLLWLIIWMPISAIISSFGAAYYGDHASATANIIRLNNYLSLVMLFIGFVYVYKGSGQLLKVIKRPLSALNMSLPLMLGFIAFAALYTFLTLSDPARLHSTSSVDIASYYEPDWLIIATIVIPRLVMWFIGILAVQNILLYRQKVKGSLYKQSLNSLAIGIGWVVLSTIVIRCIQSLSSPIGQLSLGLLLALLYSLLILISIGFVLIARGARNLRRLEEL